MPIPTPRPKEERTKFISRCMSNSIMKEYEQKQRLAICYSTWRKSKRGVAETKAIIEWYESRFKGEKQ